MAQQLGLHTVAEGVETQEQLDWVVAQGIAQYQGYLYARPLPVEQFTEQVNIRVRGRQIAMRIESSDLGVAWQLGTPRVDLRPDGRRG